MTDKYITIGDNAEVGVAVSVDEDEDALLVLDAEGAKKLLVELTHKMREANII